MPAQYSYWRTRNGYGGNQDGGATATGVSQGKSRARGVEGTVKIVIDADACPRGVLEICHRLGREAGVGVWTVASFHHEIRSDRHIVVGDAPEETDLAVANATRPGDIVVTQDWGLAALVLGRKARALSPDGRIHRLDKLPFLLEERALKARYWRGGGRTKGPRKRARADDERFTAALSRLLGLKAVE